MKRIDSNHGIDLKLHDFKYHGMSAAVFGIFLCLFVSLSATAKKRDSLWIFNKPGDVVFHGLFPIRKQSFNGFALNFEGVAWMGAMIYRINQLNEDKFLPDSMTFGYAIHDTASDVEIGLRQTLSVLNEILNKEGKQNKTLHIPVVMGPATDELEDRASKLNKLFQVPNLSYAIMSARFGYNTLGEKRIRTVPTDVVHIEALLRTLNYLGARELNVIVAKARIWKERMKIFEAFLKAEASNELKLRDVVYLNTIDDIGAVHRRINAKFVIVFAQSNISSLIIRRNGMKPKNQTWIAVSRYDDPLLRIFDSFGKETSKVIIRKQKAEEVSQYRNDLAVTEFCHKNGKPVKQNWLSSVFEKSSSERTSVQNKKSLSTECENFRKRIVNITQHEEFRSSLTLQGIIDAVNLISNVVNDTLHNCGLSTPRRCARLPAPSLFTKIKAVTQTNDGAFANSLYDIKIIQKRLGVLKSSGRRMGIKHMRMKLAKTWPVRESELRDKLRVYRNNTMKLDNNITLDNDQMNDSLNSSRACSHCGESTNQSHCVFDNVVIAWTDTAAITLYFLESLCLLAVFSTFVYFSQHKNSPIMILCYSWPDNVVLVVLCVFSLLPMMHFGQMGPHRCTTLWAVVNVIFAFYTGLLLTKTLFIQNLLKCEVATERPGKRMAFTAVVTFLQVFILASLLICDFPKSTHLACLPRGTFTLCNIQGNISILISMALNWLLMCLLFVLSLTETLKEKQNFCRTENLVAVATVAWLSYTCLASLAYFNIQIEQFLAVALIQCAIYLVNSAVCLALVYLPTVRLVSTWLRQHTRQKKNLTSIKRAQVMSSKRQSSQPIRDSLFGANFSTDQLAIPSERHSGYYFDFRPSSAMTDMSYPTSLVRSVHEQTHVVFGYGRRGGTSLHGGTSVESVPSMDWLEAPSQAHSASSSYDNLSQAAEATADEMSPQELLHEISTYWERQRSSDVIANGQYEDNVETNKWPALENLRTSDL